MSTAVRFVVVVFALLAGVLVGAGPAQAQPDVYVNASNGPGGCSGVTTVSGLDGSSWSCAYPDLQDAINSATGGDEIWVAEGVYKPASSTDSIAFSGAKDGLKIYGGFQSGDTFSQRNPEGSVTILSGDVSIRGRVGQRTTIRMATTLSRTISTSTERTRRTICI